MKRSGILLGLFLLLAVSLPIIGVILAGHPLAPTLRFPPEVTRAAPADFSWIVFSAIAIPSFCLLGWLIRRWISAVPIHAPITRRRFPWWGWVGVGVGLVAWVLAWNRFDWFAPWQSYTFTPLWLSYIVVINAAVYRRSGHSLLTHRPLRLVLLFSVSAVFWWYFEHLNRYVGNWSYAGVDALGPWEYFLQASLPFATVLPAVLGTRDWLATFPRLATALTGVRAFPVGSTRALAWLALLSGSAGLLGLGIWPRYLYPLVWVAPVLLITGLQALAGQRTLFAGLSRGDWRGLGMPALAALVCGFFWELWNWGSLARWEYSVPYVHRFLIFEMPLLGYIGYLPFGVLCAAVGDLLNGEQRASRRIHEDTLRNI